MGSLVTARWHAMPYPSYLNNAVQRRDFICSIVKHKYGVRPEVLSGYFPYVCFIPNPVVDAGNQPLTWEELARRLNHSFLPVPNFVEAVGITEPSEYERAGKILNCNPLTMVEYELIPQSTFENMTQYLPDMSDATCYESAEICQFFDWSSGKSSGDLAQGMPLSRTEKYMHSIAGRQYLYMSRRPTKEVTVDISEPRVEIIWDEDVTSIGFIGAQDEVTILGFRTSEQRDSFLAQEDYEKYQLDSVIDDFLL